MLSIPVKEFLSRKVSTDLLIDEKIVMAIASHQWDEAVKAMKKNNSVEFSGWGTFILSKNKINKKIASLHKAIDVIGDNIEANYYTERKKISQEFIRKTMMEDVKQLEERRELI